MKVRIVDTIARGSFHEIFNASLLVMCLSVFDEVEYVCHRSQELCLRNVLTLHRPLLDIARVHFLHTAVVRREGPAGWMCKYLLGAVLNLWYLFTSPRGEQLIYTNNNPFALWPVNIANKLLKRRVLIVCHGELELLARRESCWKAAGWFAAILRRMFGQVQIARNTRFCVLGSSILRNLQPYLSESNRPKFFAIDHPYFFSEPPVVSVHDGLRIGSVGQLTPDKGLYSLLDLSQQIAAPMVVVGRTYGAVIHGDYPNVRFVAGAENVVIPREQYDAEVAALDYIVFAYDAKGYKLTASGAVFDALNMRKPIITLCNDYFDDVLRFPVGYVAADTEQMAHIVHRLTTTYPENPDYAQFVENIDKLRTYYEVETVAERFHISLAAAYSE